MDNLDLVDPPVLPPKMKSTEPIPITRSGSPLALNMKLVPSTHSPIQRMPFNRLATIVLQA